MKQTSLAKVRANKFPPALALTIATSLYHRGALVCEEADELTELRTLITSLTETVQALKAKSATDSNAATELKAKETELMHAKLREQHAQLDAEHKALKAADKARREADATAAVDAAVKRGALAAKDEDGKKQWHALICADPKNAVLLAQVPGNVAMTGRITTPGVTIVKEAPNATIKEYARLVCANSKMPLGEESRKEKGRLAREAGALFAKEIATDETLISMPMEDALKAADNTDASIGLLSGTLVLQRSLDLLMFEYPILSAVTQDFSDSVGALNQTATTRIILKPAVQHLDTDTDSSGRPKGWTTTSPAQSVDVSITLDEHIGVPIVFGQHTLAQTVRNLFAEVAPMALYAIGGAAVDKLTALMTAANFNAYAGTSVGTGATTTDDNTITVASTANMYPGQSISGTGIPSNTYVASITDGTTAELTQAATATNTGLTFTLGGSKVPVAYATYVKAMADFNMASLGDIAAAFDDNEVPQQGRFALLNSRYHQRLTQDTTFNTFWAATHKPDVITKGNLPELQGITPMKAPWFPKTSNRFGFAGTKAALAIKSRLPSDFTQALAGVAFPGSVTTVTAPSGISALLAQYINPTGNYAEWRPEVLLGAARGEPRAGLVLTSQ
jgi:hypothetical protein